MNIAITGASGFLGKYILNKLITDGYNVIPYVRNTSSLIGAKCFDLNNAYDIELNNIDVLIHNAAYLPKSYEDLSEAKQCLINNGIATLHILERAEKHGVKKVIYISSGTIYDQSIWMASENDRLYPSMRATSYLTSKLVGDIFVDHFRNKSKLDTVIIRPSSIYGIGMKNAGFICRIINKLKKNEIIKDEDVGNYEVDLVNVDNVAWMVAQAATNEKISGSINVGGGEIITTLDVANILATILNKSKLNNKPSKTNGHAILNIDRAISFGYEPINIINGLQSYVRSLND